MMDLYLEWLTADEDEQVELFANTFKQCCNYKIAQEKRMRMFKLLVEMYQFSIKIQQVYDYFPTAKKYSARFIPTGSSKKSFDDGINYSAPNEKGLYFIGETHFNPITDEKFYWVKIGKALNLKDRMKSYNTHNPMLWRIDYNSEYDKEEYYHARLAQVAFAKCNHNEEWFLVDKNTYLEMREKGFSYFN